MESATASGAVEDDDIIDGVPGRAPARDIAIAHRFWGASYGGYAADASVREPTCSPARRHGRPLTICQTVPWGTPAPRPDAGAESTSLRTGTHLSGTHRACRRDKAALLIAQGKRDYRVSPEHMRIMTRALDEAGKAYELYAPHNETHGFFNDATAREYYERVFAFLARHLPVPAASGAQSADAAGQTRQIADGATSP